MYIWLISPQIIVENITIITLLSNKIKKKHKKETSHKNKYNDHYLSFYCDLAPIYDGSFEWFEIILIKVRNINFKNIIYIL